MKKLVLLFLVVILGTFSMFSCAGDGSSDGSGDGGGQNGSENGGVDNGSAKEKYTVTLKVSDGVTVITKNPIEVRAGYTASFQVSLGTTMAFRSVSAGEFNVNTGKLTLKNVNADTEILLVCEDVGYDTTVSYNFDMVGTIYDEATAEGGSHRAGTKITVNAGLLGREFLGWSESKEAGANGDFVSTDRSFTFDLSPDMVGSARSLTLYANYVEPNIIHYDANGGRITGGSDNLANNSYYTSSVSGDEITVTLEKSYYDRVGCASLFWDDGTFVRDGYVLTEYNTRADGSGEGYSLGSKFPLNLDTNTLYCIWSEATELSAFSFRDISLPLPDGVSANNASHWNTSGIVITGYTGNHSTVVIPEKIANKPVIAIASGAFNGAESMETLVMGRGILSIANLAFVGCSSLRRIYYPDAVYYVSNASFDEASFGGVTEFFVNATMAPRYQTADGSFALKFTRLLAYSHKPRIIVLAGSSAFQGLSSEYLESLLDGEYATINFGTTRTTQGYIYLEAMQYYANERDTVLYAPENSIYMLGEPTLYWKTLRDIEGMYNLFRHIDISGYENVLGAFAQYNSGASFDDYPLYEANTAPRYTRAPQRYGDATKRSNMNEYGEYILSKCADYADDMPSGTFKDVYEITFNEYVKSIKEGSFLNADPENEDWKTSDKWCKITDARYLDNLNRAIDAAKSSGAKIYFSFCPVSANEICEEAFPDIDAWLSAYDALIEDIYNFDGILGSCRSYIFDGQYFYDNAFHLNYYGRVWRTYRLYCDLTELFGLDAKTFNAVGYDFEGCRFDPVTNGVPLYGVSWLK